MTAHEHLRRAPPASYDQELDDSAHYPVDLLEAERAALLAMLEGDKRPSIQLRQYIAKKIRNAPRQVGPPLAVGSLDWRRAEREAEARGESVAEYIFDGAKPPPKKDPPDIAA